jgi:hypothetical protein
MTSRRRLVITLVVGMLATPFSSFPQQQGKVWRIGVLETQPASMNAPNMAALILGLRALGYALP